MSVNLQKGQRVDLTKGNSGLKSVMVGLGWDAANQGKSGLAKLFGMGAPDIDCDASVLLCDKDGKMRNNNDLVYYGRLSHGSGAVNHMGDNLTGDGDGDDEEILVNLSKIPEKFEKLVFVVNIYKASARKQHFGMVRNAYIRLVDNDTKAEICRYNLSENYDGYTAMIFGEVYRNEGEWKFSAIGMPTHDDSLTQLVKRYQ